ncbi:MAG: hypothetical protein WEF86_02900 [Gemmatimonadota bacterium]
MSRVSPTVLPRTQPVDYGALVSDAISDYVQMKRQESADADRAEYRNLREEGASAAEILQIMRSR